MKARFDTSPAKEKQKILTHQREGHSPNDDAGMVHQSRWLIRNSSTRTEEQSFSYSPNPRSRGDSIVNKSTRPLKQVLVIDPNQPMRTKAGWIYTLQIQWAKKDKDLELPTPSHMSCRYSTTCPSNASIPNSRTETSSPRQQSKQTCRHEMEKSLQRKTKAIHKSKEKEVTPAPTQRLDTGENKIEIRLSARERLGLLNFSNGFVCLYHKFCHHSSVLDFFTVDINGV